MSGGGGGGQNTTTQVQQIPEFEQQYAQQNQDIAASLASRPYPTYQGQMIAGFSPQQQMGMQQVQDASTAYQPGLQQAQNMVSNSAQQWSPQAAQQYMNPYAMAFLAPQLQQLAIQQGQQQLGIDRNATQAGAFGDARHGVAQGLQNFYGNLAQNDLVAQGMNHAYDTGLQAFQQGQQQQLGAGTQMGQLAAANQTLGLAGGNANFSTGSQQQQLSQEQLTNAYQNFQNQTQWPITGLNLRMAALANSPFNMTQYTTQPPANASAANLGGIASLAGAAGNLFGGGSTGGASKTNVFGGA